MEAMTGYAMKKLNVSINCPADILINTYLFTFESLLYLSLIRIYSLIERESTLQVEAAADGSNINIRFLEISQSTTPSAKASDEETILAEQIGGVCSSEENNFFINFPRDIQRK